MDYIGGDHPYLPLMSVALSFQIIFYIFPSVSKNNLYISEKIFFEKNSVLPPILYYMYSPLLHVGAIPMFILRPMPSK